MAEAQKDTTHGINEAHSMVSEAFPPRHLSWRVQHTPSIRLQLRKVEAHRGGTHPVSDVCPGTEMLVPLAALMGGVQHSLVISPLLEEVEKHRHKGVLPAVSVKTIPWLERLLTQGRRCGEDDTRSPSTHR